MRLKSKSRAYMLCLLGKIKKGASKVFQRRQKELKNELRKPE